MAFLNPPNILSLIRGPLAFLFMIDHPFYRALAVILAMITDSLDGYLARRFRTTSQLGAFLDPLMDKFFVFFILGIFIHENKLQVWQALSLMSRDFAVLIFGLYLAAKGKWSELRFRSIWAGKITTTLQFVVLLGLIFHFTIPTSFFFIFNLLGILALIELFLVKA